MATYLSRITTDMRTALKSGDKPRLEVLRMLISELKRRAIDAQVDDLPDEDELAVLQKAVKSRNETVAQANAAGRTEIAQREQMEIDVIAEYLPRQLSAAEIDARVGELAREIGFTGGKDTGRFMKEWMTRYKGVADGKLVQDSIRKLTNS
ncbi:MAG: GatB/YqeY domain-containing protein [Planctomycetota bacterium]